MYYEFFGLDYPPYRITPDTQLFYSGGERGATLDALRFAICNGDAITKVVGEVGSGKTMLCRMLELELPERVEVVYLANPSLSPENILHAIAFEIGLPEGSEPDRLKVMKALQEYLLKRHAEGRQVVVFVEEAQGMPLETLEEIRLLSNLETRQHKLLQIVLFGQPELDERLSAPHVRQIKERITNSFHLKPLKVQDIGDYLIFRLAQAGYRGPNIYSRGAIRQISKASKGLMRRINILADKALLAAYTDNRHLVSAADVRAAVRDCEFAGSVNRWRPALLVACCFSALALSTALLVFEQNTSVVKTQNIVTPIAKNEPLLNPPQSVVVAAPVIKPPIITASSEADLLETRIEETRLWLSQADPSHFSIQVMLASTAEEGVLERLLQQQSSKGELDDLYVHRINVRGKEMIGAFYGDYRSYSEAEKALKQLPQELNRFQPYLRNMQQILAESITQQDLISMNMVDY